MVDLLRIALILILVTAGQLLGQRNEDEEKTVIELKQPEPTSTAEQKAVLIGMEAFKEVLETGQYLVGPGDEFLVHVSGMEVPYFARVMAEGGIFIPQIGAVKVGGKRLKEVRKIVADAFRATVKIGDLTFELNQPRSFPIPVLGMVQEPGLKSASGVERISQVLGKAGPSLATASRRNIRVFKTGSLAPEQRAVIQQMAASGDLEPLAGVASIRVDLELYQVTGDSRFNPFVEDGDIILVPTRSGQIGALGAVQRPAYFEFVQGDRLSDLLTLALGPGPNVDMDNVFLFRFADDLVTRIAQPIDFAKVLAGEPEADLPLRPDDWLVVREIPGYHKESVVRLAGEVVYPGYYVVSSGSTTLKEIIEVAGGFTPDASLAEARVVRTQQGDEVQSEDPEYERIRFIPVSERTEQENQYFIMKSREKPGHMVVDFVELFKEGDDEQDILLMPGDVIVVPSLQRTIMVSGQVARPGAVTFDPTYTIDDYIQRAGGLGWRAAKEILVIKARTGELKRARDVIQMQPGDRIWVKEKPERDYWAIFTQGMAVVGQVSTVILLFATLSN